MVTVTGCVHGNRILGSGLFGLHIVAASPNSCQNEYKKSKYYQEKRQKLLIAAGIGGFILVFVDIFSAGRRVFDRRMF